MKTRTIILILALLAFAATTISGSLYFSTSRDLAFKEQHRKADDLLKTVEIHLAAHLETNQNTATALAGLDDIRTLFQQGDPVTLDEVNTILDRFQAAMGFEVCYLLDATGTAIASSNRDAPDSFIGKNYAFRPYFQQAIQGQPAIYLATGITSGRRGVYTSSPVYGADQASPIGVVVLKADLDKLEQEMPSTSDGIMLLVSPEGIIFASPRRAWLNMLLWEVSPEILQTITENRQFGPGPWPLTGIRPTGKDTAVDQDGNEFLVHSRESTCCPGWRFVFLHDLQAVSDLVYTPLFKTAWNAILIVCLLICLAVFFLYRKATFDLQQRKRAELALAESETRFRELFNNMSSGVLIFRPVNEGQDFVLADFNRAAEQLEGLRKTELLGKSITAIFPARPDTDLFAVFNRVWKSGSPEHLPAALYREDPLTGWREIDVYRLPSGEMIALYDDTSDRIRAEKEKEQLITELQQALSEVKTLSGFLPICASCKKIRDDKGYWKQIESYIRDHSDLQLSHGICPDCARKLYPDLVDDDFEENEVPESL